MLRRTLQAIICDIDPALRPAVDANVGGYDIPRIVSSPESAKKPYKAFVLNRWAEKFSFMTGPNPTREHATLRAQQLLDSEPEAFTENTRAELAALLLDLPEHVRPNISIKRGRISLERAFREPGNLGAARELLRVYGVAARAASDPQFRAQRLDQIEALVRGAENPDVAGELRAGLWVPEFETAADRAIASSNGLDAAEVAGRALPFTEGNSEQARKLLLEISRNLAVDLPLVLRPLRDETMRLADINAERIAGRTPPGEIRGYSNYPEYAEFGTIRANLESLRMMLEFEQPSNSVTW